MTNWEKRANDFIGEPLSVGFKRLNDDATIPTKAHATDSGFDLYASEDVIIEPGETKVIPTGIAVQLPEGYEAQVRPRSGVTTKTKLRVQLGTIDNGYAGDIGVIVDNISKGSGPYFRLPVTIEGTDVAGYGVFDVGTHLIRKGDRIAQLVVQPLPAVEAVEVFDVVETDRGGGGFGSTGVREKYTRSTIGKYGDVLSKLADTEEHGKCSYCKNEIAGTDKSADNVICKTCGDIMTREHSR